MEEEGNEQNYFMTTTAVWSQCGQEAKVEKRTMSLYKNIFMYAFRKSLLCTAPVFVWNNGDDNDKTVGEICKGRSVLKFVLPL